VEPENRGAVGRRAFREDRDDVARGQRVGRMPVDPVRVVPARALDEERSGAADQPADDGPASELRLADEARGPVRVQHHDVEPRYVVRDDEDVAAVRLDRAVDARLDVHHAQELLRPAPDQRAPALGRHPRKHQRRRRDARGDVQRDARRAPEPDRQAHRPVRPDRTTGGRFSA